MSEQDDEGPPWPRQIFRRYYMRVVQHTEHVIATGFVEISEQCYFCAHRFERLAQCAAYPDGIPSLVLDGFADHSRPLPGDGGVRFELASAGTLLDTDYFAGDQLGDGVVAVPDPPPAPRRLSDDEAAGEPMTDVDTWTADQLPWLHPGFRPGPSWPTSQEPGELLELGDPGVRMTIEPWGREARGEPISVQAHSLQCLICGHRQGDTMTCAAYPEGIPDLIARGHVSHGVPRPGDRGLQWVRVPDGTRKRLRGGYFKIQTPYVGGMEPATPDEPRRRLFVRDDE